MNYAKISYSNVFPLILDYIEAPRHGKVVFESALDRQDLPESRIRGFTVFNERGDRIRSITLFQHFQYSPEHPNSVASADLESTGTDSRIFRRMFLDSLSIDDNAGNVVQRYSFDYNDLDHLPMRLAYAQDHWGYYNGANNFTLLPDQIPQSVKDTWLPVSVNADREPNASYAQKGTIRKVTFLTGGSTVFTYGANRDYQNRQMGGVRVESHVQNANDAGTQLSHLPYKVSTLIVASHGDYRNAYFNIGSSFFRSRAEVKNSQYLARIAKTLGADAEVIFTACHLGAADNGGQSILKAVSMKFKSTVYGNQSFTPGRDRLFQGGQEYPAYFTEAEKRAGIPGRSEKNFPGAYGDSGKWTQVKYNHGTPQVNTIKQLFFDSNGKFRYGY